MKKTTYDQQAAYRDLKIDIEYSVPLSSERIKELTMREINKETSPKTLTVTFRILIAAAIIMTFAVSAFAVGPGMECFQQFFADSNGTTLSDAQIAFITENAFPINQSKTVDGYVLNVESVLHDKRTVYVKLNLYAPEGVVLPYGDSRRFKTADLHTPNGDTICNGWSMDELYDEDKTDNHTDMLMTFDLEADVDTNLFLTNSSLMLELTNLYKSYGPYFSRKTKTIAEGSWLFELHFATPQTNLREHELISEPVSCTMVKNLTGEKTEIFLTSVCLRALTVDVVYDYPDGADLESLVWWGIKAVKKDGTAVNIVPSSGSIQPTDNQITGYITLKPNAPIIADELAYIEFPGGVQIPVNIGE